MLVKECLSSRFKALEVGVENLGSALVSGIINPICVLFISKYNDGMIGMLNPYCQYGNTDSVSMPCCQYGNMDSVSTHSNHAIFYLDINNTQKGYNIFLLYIPETPEPRFWCFS